MAKKSQLAALVSTAVATLADKSVQKVLFGTYSDNTPRSLVDCVNGEILSPKDREKYLYKKKKKKNKSKKKRSSFWDD